MPYKKEKEPEEDIDEEPEEDKLPPFLNSKAFRWSRLYIEAVIEVLKRDRGKCACCGLRVSVLEAVCRIRYFKLLNFTEGHRLDSFHRRWLSEDALVNLARREARSYRLAAKWDDWVISRGWPTMEKWSQWYHVHHRVSVKDGGSPTDPNNLEVLCLKCHKEATKVQQRVWAERRRAAKLVG